MIIIPLPTAFTHSLLAKDIIIKNINDAKKYVLCIPVIFGEQRLHEAGFNSKKLKESGHFQSQCLGMLYRDRVDLNLFNGIGIRDLGTKQMSTSLWCLKP